VIIAVQHAEGEDVLDLVRTAKSLGIRVSLMPRVFEVVGSSVEFDEIDGMPLLGVRRYAMSRSSQLVKRGVDLVGALVLLLIGAPALVAIAAAIKLDSRGPVFFRQTRVGREGRTLRMVKFRTMHDGADRQKESLARQNEAADGFFKITDDPRVTRVGRFLRRTYLDELPQLWNVLRGEMSLVGPRPLVVEEDALIEGWSRRRLNLTPGMTGHWQVLGSSRIPLRDMVKIDYLYVANWSLWLDFKLLLRTLRHVLRRGNV
jgi:exopolysaccharide biosynthesis polyprenyl glycosylphosphotransferase